MWFIRKNAIALLFVFLFTPVHAFNGLGSGDDLVAEAEDVPAAVEIVKTALHAQGYSIELVVDHEAAAASVGLVLRPTQVIFARPSKRVERSLLFRSSTIGLDLPIKFLVYEEDVGGAIRLNFNSVGYLFDRHDPFGFESTRVPEGGFYISEECRRIKRLRRPSRCSTVSVESACYCG